MDSRTPQRISSAAGAAAADWFARLQEEDATEQDFQEWQRWLNASAENTAAYRQMEHAWHLIGEAQGDAVGGPESADSLDASPTMQSQPHSHSVPRSERVPRRSRARRYAVAAGLAMALTGAGIAYLLTKPGSYSTHTAEQRSVRLSDGSRLTLGAASKVTSSFDETSRRIVLNFGEAYFEVSPDPRRPFTVVVGENEIRAIGTAFNVRAAGDGVWVNVTEGRVAVISDRNNAAREVKLAAGEQAAITPSGSRKTSEVAAVTWMQGRFEYRGEELRHVIDDLNRYTDRQIVLTDESLGHLRYSGTVFPDHLDEWLQGIGGALPVVVRDEPQRREISAAR